MIYSELKSEVCPAYIITDEEGNFIALLSYEEMMSIHSLDSSDIENILNGISKSYADSGISVQIFPFINDISSIAKYTKVNVKNV